MIRIICTLILTVFGQIATAETMRLAVTTSFENAGLADVLLPKIKADTGIDIQLLVVGTGQALRLGAAGDVDAVIVHSEPAETAFIAAGHGTERHILMYNDFVLIGPASDPANASNAQSVTQAVDLIHKSKAPFISRGDQSGTHQAEIALWQQANLIVQDFGAWYLSVGAGMGAALNTAAAMNAYILSDRASWINFRNKAELAIVYEGDPALFNQYSYIPVHPDKAHVNHNAALRLQEWLLSPAARDVINGYTLSGQRLFTYNATYY